MDHPGKRYFRAAVMVGSMSALLSGALAAQPLPLGDEFTVHTTTAGTQSRPAAGMRDAGSFVIAWLSDGTNHNVLWASFSASGSPSVPETTLSSNIDITGLTVEPSVAMSASGDWIGAWPTNSGVGNLGDPIGRRVSNLGNMAVEQNLASDSTPDVTFVAVDRSDDGAFAAVWLSDASDVFVRRFTAGGAPVATEVELTGAPAGTFSRTDVAAIAGGNAAAVWSQLDNGSVNVFGGCVNAAGVLVAFPLIVASTGDQVDPVVAVDGSGEFLAVWTDEGQSRLEGTRFGCFVPGSVEIVLANGATGVPEIPALDRAPDGAFVVVWEESPGGDSVVMAREFTKEGAPVGDPFDVSTDVADDERDPTVAINGDRFVVAWTEGGDGIEARIFRRRVMFTDGFERAGLNEWTAASP